MNKNKQLGEIKEQDEKLKSVVKLLKISNKLLP